MLARHVGLLATVLILASGPAVGTPGPSTLIGHETTYQVQPNDSLGRIAARHHLSPRALRGMNRLQPAAKLEPGQVLRLSTRHLVPPAAGAAIVINIPDLRLYRYRGDRLAGWYPVALGQPFDSRHAEDPARWQTPAGTFKVAELRRNPVWRVPKSIQAEMAAEGKVVQERMPPGPENPLGKYWIGLSKWGYGIHGTIAPTTVGRYKTHGCIRMTPGHIERVFASVRLGNVVRITYEPVKVATFGQQVWLEVAPDTYDKVPDMRSLALAKLAAAGATDRIDARRVDQVVKDRWGVAVRVDPLGPPLSAPVVPAARPSPKGP